MKHETTRRAFIAGSAAATVAVSLPAVALAAPADRRAWEHAMAHYERAKAEADAYDETLFRIHDAWKAGKPSMDAIPWKEFPGAHREHLAHGADLDAEWQRFLQGEGKWWFARDPEATKAKHRAALDAVQAYRDAKDRWNEESGIDAAYDHSEALTDRFVACLDTLLEMPAPDQAALRWKLDYLIDADLERGHGTSAWSADYVAQTLADIARLLPQGR